MLTFGRGFLLILGLARGGVGFEVDKDSMMADLGLVVVGTSRADSLGGAVAVQGLVVEVVVWGAGVVDIVVGAVLGVLGFG